MRRLIKILLLCWKVKQEQKKKFKEFLKIYKLRLIKLRDTSVILYCIIQVPSGKKGRYNLVREKDGYVLEKDLTLNEYIKKSEEYTKAAAKRKIPLELYLKKIVEEAKLLKGNLVKLYRIQGGKVPNASRHRFKIVNGKLKIIGNERLYITFKDENRVLEYWIKRGENAEVFTATVNQTFFDKIVRNAVKQSRGKEFPLNPQYGDASKTDYSFGIPKNYFDELLENINDIEILKLN